MHLCSARSFKIKHPEFSVHIFSFWSFYHDGHDFIRGPAYSGKGVQVDSRIDLQGAFLPLNSPRLDIQTEE
jgi:hypothetical protein